MAEGEGSSPGGSVTALPGNTETPWQQQKEESTFVNKPGSSNSPDDALVQGDRFKNMVSRHLRMLVPHKALRTYISHVVRALRMDCSLPELQLACAKMVSKTGLLIKLLSERQDDQRASAFAGQCLQEERASNGTAPATEAGRKPTEESKPASISIDLILILFVVSGTITVTFIGICLFQVCSEKAASASQPQSTKKSWIPKAPQKSCSRGEKQLP
ncbi:leucine-rich repeat-containing protein 37A3-like [Rhynochetos jubatus]